MLFAVEINVPTHVPVYQAQFAPVPRFPPEIDKFVVSPEQMVDEEMVIDEGGVDNIMIVIRVLEHSVVLHVPSALTK